jgi:hypothetical protein
MNERIKALYDQSLIREHGTDHEGNPMLKITIDQQKFADLIVKECAEFVSNDRRNDDYGVFVANRIKEHFGVEHV